MIPFYIITGWLGSGKTTLLKNILNHYGEKRRIAVVQNEFAPTGVDGKELKNTGTPFRLIEVNNGSVFCVCQLDNFVHALEKLANDFAPDVIFLESSGLADPISIAQILNAPAIKEKILLKEILTVIDAVNFERTFQMMVRFKHQVIVADELVINKTDLAEKSPEPIVTQLKKWNPFARISTCSFANINLEILLDNQTESGKNRKFLPFVKAGNKPKMEVAVLRLHELISKDQLLAFLNQIMPTSQRIKGFVHTKEGQVIAVQTVFDKIELSPIDQYDGRTELIIFNNHYSTRELHQLFKNKAADE